MKAARAAFRRAGPIGVILLLVGGAAIWSLRGGHDVGHLQTLLSQHPAAPLLFILLHILSSLVFVPRSALAVLAGLIFGSWWGGLLAAMGSVCGAVAGFLIARYISGGMVGIKEKARVAQVMRRIERGGWRSVAMLRLVPVLPHTAVNYALGLTRVRLGPYAFGSLVGQLPMTLAFVQFGAAGDHLLDSKPDWIVPTLVGAAILALSSVLPKLLSWLPVQGGNDGVKG